MPTTLAGLRSQVARLRREVGAATPTTAPTLERLRADPTTAMSLAGRTPDPWQAQLLRSSADRHLLLCCRQSGKTEVAAAMAVREAVLKPRSLVLLLSPSERQSGELAQRAFGYYDRLGQPVPATKRTELQLYLSNGSRVIALPGKEGTIRGFAGARLLLIDEAARVPDDLYRAVRPMLAVSRGRLVAMSTPWGRRGFFYEAWTGTAPWERIKITATQCPRISPQFLAEERVALGLSFFEQEYYGQFNDMVGAVFGSADIQAAFSGLTKPFWPTGGTA
jgi:hypothetical protein